MKLGLSGVLGLPILGWMTVHGDTEVVTHAVLEYGQFMVMLGSLYAVSGGIFLAGDLRATPRNNLLLLAAGGVLASFIGTTGAAMCLIRPILSTNQQRTHMVHTVVFAILIIANCGGLLTPLGDPPLFMGMLRGVPFTWTFHLFPQWVFVNGLLLMQYWAVERRFAAQEPIAVWQRDEREQEPLRVRGFLSVAMLGCIVLSVAFLPSIEPSSGQWIPWRELAMLSATTVSLRLGSSEARTKNRFTWAPMQEVGALFAGIFATMPLAIAYLRVAAPELGFNNETALFCATGAFSAVLDNAPTYVTFFEIAQALGGSPAVAGVKETFLVAISLGAVLCGALTYIGNGPNFMVKAVAEEAGVQMPNFFQYIGWAIRYLGIVLVAMVCIFISESQIVTTIGIGIACVIVVSSIFTGSRASAPATLVSRS